MATITSTNTRNMLPGIVGQPRNVNSPYHYEKRDTATLGNNIAGLGNTFGKLAINLSAGARQRRDNDMALAVRNYKVQLDSYIADTDTGTEGKDWGANSATAFADRKQKARDVVYAQFPELDRDRFEKEVFSIDVATNTTVNARMKGYEDARTKEANVARVQLANDMYATDGDIDALISEHSSVEESNLNLVSGAINAQYTMFDELSAETNITWDNDTEYNKFREQIGQLTEITIGDKKYRVVEDDDAQRLAGTDDTIARSQLLAEADTYRSYKITRDTVAKSDVIKSITPVISSRVGYQLSIKDYDGARQTMDNARNAATKYNLSLQSMDFVKLDDKIRSAEAANKGFESAKMFFASLKVGDDGYMDSVNMNKIDAEIDNISSQLNDNLDPTTRSLLESKKQTLANLKDSAESANKLADSKIGQARSEEYQNLIGQGVGAYEAFSQVYGNDDFSRPFVGKALAVANAKNSLTQKVQYEAEAPMRAETLKARKDYNELRLANLQARIQTAKERNDKKAQADAEKELAKAQKELEKLAKQQSIEEGVATAMALGDACGHALINQQELLNQKVKEANDKFANDLNKEREKINTTRGEADIALIYNGKYGAKLDQLARHPELTNKYNRAAIELAGIVEKGIGNDNIDAKTLTAIALYTKSTGRGDFVFNESSLESRKQLMSFIAEDKKLRAEHPEGKPSCHTLYTLGEFTTISGMVSKEKSSNDAQYEESLKSLEDNLQIKYEADIAKAQQALNSAANALNPDHLRATMRFDDFVSHLPKDAFGSRADIEIAKTNVSTWRSTQVSACVNLLASAKDGTISYGGGQASVSNEEEMMSFCRVNGFTQKETDDIINRVKVKGADIRLAQEVIHEFASMIDPDLANCPPAKLAVLCPAFVTELADYANTQRMSKPTDKELRELVRNYALYQSGMMLEDKKLKKNGNRQRETYVFSIGTTTSDNGIRTAGINKVDDYKNIWRALSSVSKELDITNPDKYGDSYEGFVTIAWDSTGAANALKHNPDFQKQLNKTINDAITANIGKVGDINE